MSISMTGRWLSAAVLTVAAFASAACGHPNSSTGGTLANATGAVPPQGEFTQSPPLTGSSTTAARTVIDHFGSECDKIPTDPKSPASFAGMGNETAATAMSNNPLTGKLFEAVQTAQLTDVLNTAGNLTILAPDDHAFDKLPNAQLDALLNNKDALLRVLTYHVIPKRLSPEELTGTMKTLEGANVVFHGDKPAITVGPTGTEAHIVCGNIITQNATLYVIDTVLQPPS